MLVFAVISTLELCRQVVHMVIRHIDGFELVLVLVVRQAAICLVFWISTALLWRKQYANQVYWEVAVYVCAIAGLIILGGILSS